MLISCEKELCMQKDVCITWINQIIMHTKINYASQENIHVIVKTTIYSHGLSTQFIHTNLSHNYSHGLSTQPITQIYTRKHTKLVKISCNTNFDRKRSHSIRS